MTLLPWGPASSSPPDATGRRLHAGAGAPPDPEGRYATIPCGSMTYFLAAPWSKRW